MANAIFPIKKMGGFEVKLSCQRFRAKSYTPVAVRPGSEEVRRTDGFGRRHRRHSAGRAAPGGLSPVNYNAFGNWTGDEAGGQLPAARPWLSGRSEAEANYLIERPASGRWRTSRRSGADGRSPAGEAAEGSFATPGKTMTGAAEPTWRVFFLTGGAKTAHL